ncbi:MAG: type I phosphomannose isomerase catalytic subunit [Fimbriiglobus sp.]
MAVPLYPLRFDPIFKSMLWGGRRLPGFLRQPAPGPDPVAEAWVLSDVDGSPSRVANGPLAGTTLRELIAADPHGVLGSAAGTTSRFPLLLKFIDARQELSVQVHPNDEQARAKTPGASGKTEAWVILDANPATSRIYAGFRDGVGESDFRSALETKTTPHTLHSFTPTPGDCVFLPANTVHAIGADILLFEVQQTSDITYRLYDWDRTDAKTGKPRELHVDDGLACSDFASGPCRPVTPVPGGDRERLVACDYFTLHRVSTDTPVTLGAVGACRAVVLTAGRGTLGGMPLEAGDVVLLPAAVGGGGLTPAGPTTVLECGIPG